MKRLLYLTATIALTVFVGGFLEALHANLYESYYETCKQALLAQNNFKTQEQVFECVETKPAIRVLGTLLWREGSVL